MNFYKYIGISPEEFAEKYIATRLVEVGYHDDFPLNIYTYGRKCVQEQAWDGVTSKCRGIIVNAETGEIVARPFEKFHNYGSEQAAPAPAAVPAAPTFCRSLGAEPVVWEKMDGFMCTVYTWKERNYVASKGSFHSTHAKWATKEFNRVITNRGYSETGGSVRSNWTLVFEGLNHDLRIVVDYKDRQELVLLAVINNETGEELFPQALKRFARTLGFSTPIQNNLTLAEASAMTMNAKDSGEEGFVLTWYHDWTTPFRLKMKFIEYLRLHRLVTNVSPKHIWEVLSGGQTAELTEYLTNSTPWFKKFAEKWIRALTTEYKRLENEAATRYFKEKQAVDVNICKAAALRSVIPSPKELRKAYATVFAKEEHREFTGIMFAILDGKDIRPIIWKQVKPMTKDKNPMVNGFAY